MGFFSICEGDPLIDTLRTVFDANIVRVPEERVKPLTVVASCDKKSAFRGALLPLIDGELPALNDSLVESSRMADISGKRTRKVSVDIGLQVLEGFLGGFGIPSAGISTKFSGASEVSFSFQNVERRYVDSNFVGRVLNGHTIDVHNPAAAIFFGNDPCDLLVIDSVITSSDFSINVNRFNSDDFKLDVPAIQNLVGKLNTEVSVSTTSGYDLVFKGDKHLTFAFSCIRLTVDAGGQISSAPPAFDRPLLLAHSQSSGNRQAHDYLDSPDRVLLTDKPSLITWDE